MQQGGLLLLHGVSGAGKSTWLALAAGLLRASAGCITVADQQLELLGVSGSAAWRAAHIGFLPQKLHLSAALNVRENLALAHWAAGRPADDTQILGALSALGISDLLTHRVSQLSGGQARRVALARAVLFKPRVIVADEPTASLDDDAAAAAVRLLRDTARRDRATLIMATHDSRIRGLLLGEKNLQTLFIKQEGR